MDPEDLVAADPMMRIVRERHPDVNIVLLPAIEPILDRPSATPAQCRAVQEHADTVLAVLSGVHQPSTRIDYWWSQAHPEIRRWVTAASWAVGTDGHEGNEAAIERLREVGNQLRELGWDPRPAAEGRPRLRGSAGQFELVASAAGGVLSITLTSDPLYIPAALHETLVSRS